MWVIVAHWFKGLREKPICSCRFRGWLAPQTLLPVERTGPTALPQRRLASPAHSRASSSCAERWRRAPAAWAHLGGFHLVPKSLIDPQGDQVISARLLKAVLCATSRHLPVPWFGKKEKKHSPLEWKESQCKVMCSYHVAQRLCFAMFSLVKLKYPEKDAWLQNPFLKRNVNTRGSLRQWTQ